VNQTDLFLHLPRSGLSGTHGTAWDPRLGRCCAARLGWAFGPKFDHCRWSNVFR